MKKQRMKVKKKVLNKKYVNYYTEVHATAKEIIHGKLTHVDAKKLDEYLLMAARFLGQTAKLVDDIIDSKS